LDHLSVGLPVLNPELTAKHSKHITRLDRRNQGGLTAPRGRVKILIPVAGPAHTERMVDLSQPSLRGHPDRLRHRIFSQDLDGPQRQARLRQYTGQPLFLVERLHDDAIGVSFTTFIV
jgi:hypothetical protein